MVRSLKKTINLTVIVNHAAADDAIYVDGHIKVRMDCSYRILFNK